MVTTRVMDIVSPLSEEIPTSPSVDLHDTLSTAIERMARYNTRQLAVLSDNAPVGMIRLEDALRVLGLEVTLV